jgi:hypothetical protein
MVNERLYATVAGYGTPEFDTLFVVTHWQRMRELLAGCVNF